MQLQILQNTMFGNTLISAFFNIHGDKFKNGSFFTGINKSSLEDSSDRCIKVML